MDFRAEVDYAYISYNCHVADGVCILYYGSHLFYKWQQESCHNVGVGIKMWYLKWKWQNRCMHTEQFEIVSNAIFS